VEIKGRGRQQSRENDSIVAGQTTMQLEISDNAGIARQTNYLENGTLLLPERRDKDSGIAIAKDVDATAIEAALASEDNGDVAARQLKIVCDLPFHFATKMTLDTLLPAVVDQLVEILPNAESWALVLRDTDSDAILLKAYHYVQRIYLSETLLRRAMAECKAFVWKKSTDVEMSGSLVQSGIEVGMYAPLVWQGEALGAICAGAHNAETVFSDEDVKLRVFVGQYAAMAVATHLLQEKLRHESVIKSNLLRQFSPKVANHMLTHRGRLRLGGQRGEVTILMSDIRGFTQMAHDMDPDDVVEMLNEYLRVLVPIIFANNGTVDKFMGDAVLAIFGSPEPDPKHHENALKAAVEMQRAAAKLNESLEQRRTPYRHFGIGIHCGEVVHGFVGTSDRMEFTVIGDADNRVSRYCAAAAEQEILISPEMHQHVWRMVETEEASIITKHEGNLVAYRVKQLKECASAGATLHIHKAGESH
jgi:adenylate cyclase